MIIYLFAKNPYKSLIHKIRDLIIEINFVGIYIFTIPLAFSESVGTRKVVSGFIIFFCIVILTTEFVIIMYDYWV